MAGPAVSPDGSRVAYMVDGRDVAIASLVEGGPWPVRLSAGADFCFDRSWSRRRHPGGLGRMGRARPCRGTTAASWSPRPMLSSGAGPVAASRHRSQPARPASPRTAAVSGLLCDGGGWVNLWQSRRGRRRAGSPAGRGGRAWGTDRGDRGSGHGSGRRRGPDRLLQKRAGLRPAVPARRRNRRRSGTSTVACTGGSAGLDRCSPGDRSGARTPTQVVVIEPGGSRAKRRRSVVRGPVAGFEAAGLVEPEVVSWESEHVVGSGHDVHGRLYPNGRPPQGADAASPARSGPMEGRPVRTRSPGTLGSPSSSTGDGTSCRWTTGARPAGAAAYAQALREQWGHLDVADTAAGMRAAAVQGWGHPDRMVPIGGSAGGLTVLLLLARHQDLCAAGVSLYGVADLFELDETTHRFEAHYLQSLIGVLPAAAERYGQRSPINHAAAIAAPLLVLQGSADRVVPKPRPTAWSGGWSGPAGPSSTTSMKARATDGRGPRW